MSEAVGKKFIYRDKIVPVSDFDSTYQLDSPSIYEVLRVENGIPLFWEDHYSRFQKSVELLGYALNFTLEELRSLLILLIQENSFVRNNVKIVVNQLDATCPALYLFGIESHYPPDDLYKRGIETITYQAVRENPNAKVIYAQMRNAINERLQETQCYEALLVNAEAHVTEGSRSNLFFIKDGTVYTAPENEVLIGITRIKVFALCKRYDIPLVEAPILLLQLNQFEAAFISGTSPKLLPIKSIDNIRFAPENPLLRQLIEWYDQEIEAYYCHSGRLPLME